MMNIVSVKFISEEDHVEITMDDGSVCYDQSSLPSDTAIRSALDEWVAAGGVIEAFVPPAPPAKTRIYKATIWRRCTDAEFSAIKQAISATPERIQAIFNDAVYLDTGDELYPMVLSGAEQAVGAERAAELLEPEE